jgi:hypothetical protein
MQKQEQYSDEEAFCIDLDNNYECYTFTNQDGSTIYLYDRKHDDH